MITLSHNYVYENCSYKSIKSGDIASIRIYITIGYGEVINVSAALSVAYELEFIELILFKLFQDHHYMK